jgi:hypothetical protein
VLLLAPGDTLASPDSLVRALRRHGLTTLVLHPRGHGASVGPSCPSPDAWFDREAAIEERVARDVGDVFRFLRHVERVDTTRYVVAAAGASAGMAIRAAQLDPRARALLLVAPAPPEVEVGRARARLAQIRVPVFFQVGGDDFGAGAVADMLYQAGDRATSRVAEVNVGGSRYEQFRYDPALAARFLRWLDATVRPAPGRPVPRPTPPRPHP